MAIKKYIMPFNYNIINEQTAWLLGFIFAESTIGFQQGYQVVKVYNKNKELLNQIRDFYKIPYKVTTQNNKENTVHFIRISDQSFVKSIENLGFIKDKSNLVFPNMTKECELQFISGFLLGKGSFFKEEKTNVHGFKIVFRSRSFIHELSKKIAFYSLSKVANPHCRKIVNIVSCELKYVNVEADLVANYFGLLRPE